MKNILTASQWDKKSLKNLFKMTDRMKSLVERRGGDDSLKHKVMTALFYESSTRTSSSFIAAMQRLGGSVIPITQGIEFSSVSKGETFYDSLRTLEQYSDVIVVRHPETGLIESTAPHIKTPIISAGSGSGEHPTQSLLDLYTIKQRFGSIDGLKIAFVGDITNGRTIHSLTTLLNLYDTEISYVSPTSLQWNGDNGDRYDKIEDVIHDVDVLYMTRIQSERMDKSDYDKVKGYYNLTPETMKLAKEDMIVMHPFPRVNEIDVEVDNDPRAWYFRQIESGLFIRMALLKLLLKPEREFKFSILKQG